MYPKTIEFYIDNLLIISEFLIEIIFNHIEIPYISHLLIISLKLIKKFTSCKLEGNYSGYLK
jgi:hypothetical protein